MSRHPRLVERVSRRLASQAFSQKYQLELSLFGDKAEAKRAGWVDRSWPTHVDCAREVLAEILPDVLLVTYRDKGAALRRLEAARGDELLEAVRKHAAAVAANEIGDKLVDLFGGPLLGSKPPFPSTQPLAVTAEAAPCSKS